MLPELQRRFSELEETRRMFVAGVEEMTPAQRTFRPDSESWSSLLVLHHVMLVEQEALRFLESGREPGPARFKHALMRIGARLVLGSPIRLKAPIERIKPKEDLALEEVAARWEQVRAGLRTYLERIPEDRVDRHVFYHPVAGPFDIIQTLGFLASHLRHHRRQLQRLRNSSDFPAS